MALSRNRIVRADQFSGAGKVHSQETAGLGDVVREVLIKQAAIRLSVENITAITDNSGGTAGGTIAAVVRPASADLSSLTTGVTPASYDTSNDTVMTSYATLLEQANLVLSELGLGSVGEGPGTGGSGTIAVLDVDVATNASDTTATDHASSQLIMDDLLNSQATVIKIIDICREAVGLAVTTQAAGAGYAQALVQNQGVGSPVDIGTGAIANAVVTTATTIATAVTEVAVELALGVFQDNIAELADQLDEVTNIVATNELLYVAGS